MQMNVDTVPEEQLGTDGLISKAPHFGSFTWLLYSLVSHALLVGVLHNEPPGTLAAAVATPGHAGSGGHYRQSHRSKEGRH